MTYSLKIPSIPSSLVLDREARVSRHTALPQQLTFLSRSISRGTAFQRASADTHMVRQTPMSCLDNLAVRGTLLLYSFGRVGGGGRAVSRVATTALRFGHGPLMEW